MSQSIRSNANRLRAATILDRHERECIRGLLKTELDGSTSNLRHAKGEHGVREVVQNAVPGITQDDAFREAKLSQFVHRRSGWCFRTIRCRPALQGGRTWTL
jgi:hypothetical protein